VLFVNDGDSGARLAGLGAMDDRLQDIKVDNDSPVAAKCRTSRAQALAGRLEMTTDVANGS
jgi:hypothetical protein